MPVRRESIHVHFECPLSESASLNTLLQGEPTNDAEVTISGRSFAPRTIAVKSFSDSVTHSKAPAVYDIELEFVHHPGFEYPNRAISFDIFLRHIAPGR
jgi:hypothetical protein